jgi:WD40 repeat protein
MDARGLLDISNRDRSVGSGWVCRASIRVLFAVVLWASLGSPSRADLLVCDGSHVQRYDDVTGASRGAFTADIPNDRQFVLALGPDGNLYVAVNSSGAVRGSFVRRFDGKTGAFIDTFASIGENEGVPEGLAFGPDGNLYSCSAGRSSRVIRFNGQTGALIGDFVPEGSGGLDSPTGLAFGPDGNLYVLSGSTNQVLRYDGSTGAFLGAFATTGSEPDDIVFGPDGNLYVLDHPGGGFGEVRRFHGTTGSLVDVFVPPFSGGGGSLAFGPDRNLYITASSGVLKIDGTHGGAPETFVASGGSGDLLFSPLLCDSLGDYGPCDTGAGTRCRADGPREVGKDLTAVIAIDVVDCGPADGPAGFQIAADCPSGYSYCVETRDDGAGNRVKLGVTEEAPIPAGVIVVNDSSDALHDPGCATLGTGTCTLRDAINFANANAGDNAVHFDIAGSGVHTISLGSDLPLVTENLKIDGYTQSGSSPNTNGPWLADNAVLTIEINGNGKGCLAFIGGLANEVRGLVINRCGGRGISWVDQFDVGGLVPLGVVVAGNFIGTDPTGSVSEGNAGGGVAGLTSDPLISPQSHSTVGGEDPGDRNVISGNAGDGVLGAVNVLGNFIGTDAAGTTALPNSGHGVEQITEGRIEGNLISGNGGIGVSVHDGDGAHGLAPIQDNRIGTDVSGTLPLGNSSKGIFVFERDPASGGAGAFIKGNIIAFNGRMDPNGAGIAWRGGSVLSLSPAILGNSIFENTRDGTVPNRGLGIDLNANGPGQIELPCNGSEGGFNVDQNFPILSSAVTTGSSIRIQGTLDTAPFGTNIIEFFASPACDPTGFGEGQTFLGSAQVEPNGTGPYPGCQAAFDVILPVSVDAGQVITATATGDWFFSSSRTSEFSACVSVEAAGEAEVVNDLVALVSMTQESNVAPVPGGPAGTKTIRATFRNSSTTPIEAPFFVVSELSAGNLLLNADGGAGGAGARLTGDAGADGVLMPGESFTTEFVIGLQSRRRFRFFVDVWGTPIQ